MPGASSQWLYDVVDGVFARASFDDVTVTVSRDTDATEPNFTGDFGNLSPRHVLCRHPQQCGAARLRRAQRT